MDTSNFYTISNKIILKRLLISDDQNFSIERNYYRRNIGWKGTELSIPVEHKFPFQDKIGCSANDHMETIS